MRKDKDIFKEQIGSISSWYHFRDFHVSSWIFDILKTIDWFNIFINLYQYLLSLKRVPRFSYPSFFSFWGWDRLELGFIGVDIFWSQDFGALFSCLLLDNISSSYHFLEPLRFCSKFLTSSSVASCWQKRFGHLCWQRIFVSLLFELIVLWFRECNDGSRFHRRL